MSKYTLVYTGTESKRGPALCDMLSRHKSAMFIETDKSVFEVTAETGFDRSIGDDPAWRADRLEAKATQARHKAARQSR